MAVVSPYNKAEQVVITNETTHVPIGSSATRSIVRSTTGVLLQVVERGSLGDTGETELTLWRSTDGGSTWSFLTQLESGSSPDYGWCLYLDPSNNNAYIVWADKAITLEADHELNFKKLTWDGGNSTWTVGSTVEIVDSSTTFAVGGEPGIVKDADGDLFVACQYRTDAADSFNLRSWYSTDDGSTWNQSVASHTTSRANALVQAPSLAANSSKVLMVWENYLGTVYSYKRVNSDAQTTWASEVTVSPSGINSPSLTVDSDGNFHYVGFASTNCVIYAKKYTSSTDTWESDVSVFSHGENGVIQGMQATAKGTTLYIFWARKKAGFGGNSSVDPAHGYYVWSKDAGATWSSPIKITPAKSDDEWTRVFLYDANAAEFYDRTFEATQNTSGDVISPNTGCTILNSGDILYLGLDDLFESQRFIYVPYMASQADSGGAKQWEYWDGSAWSTIGGSSLNAPFSSTTGGYISLSDAVDGGYPNDWAKTTINGYNAYWVRLRVTSTLSTGAKASQLTSARPLVFPQTPLKVETGDTTIPVAFAEDSVSASPFRAFVTFSSITADPEVHSVTAGQIDLVRVLWGEWSDTASFEVGVTTEAYSTTAGQIIAEKVALSTTAGSITLENLVLSTTAGLINLEAIARSVTAGQILLEGLTKSTTAGLINLETADQVSTTAGQIVTEETAYNTTAGQLILEALGRSTTAGRIDLEDLGRSTTAGIIELQSSDQYSVTAGQIPLEVNAVYSTTAGQIFTEAHKLSTTAGQIEAEGLGRSTTAGMLDLQLEQVHTSAGLLDLEAISKATTAGQIDLFREDTIHSSAGQIVLERIVVDASAGQILLEAIVKSTTAGRIDLEADTRSVTAGRIDIEDLTKSTSAGIIELQVATQSTTAGQILIEAHKLSTTAGQVDLVGGGKSTTAGRIDAETTSRSTSAGLIDIEERVSGQISARVDRMMVEGYTKPSQTVGISSPKTPKGFVSHSENEGSVIPSKPKGYIKR